MNVDEILTMHKDDAIVIITGKHPTRVKKAYQYVLFPNVTSSLRVSQLSYQNKPSQEVLDWLEGKREEYDEYFISTERQETLEKADVEMYEKQVVKAEKEAERQEELAMSFFSQMNATSSTNPSKKGILS